MLTEDGNKLHFCSIITDLLPMRSTNARNPLSCCYDGTATYYNRSNYTDQARSPLLVQLLHGSCL